MINLLSLVYLLNNALADTMSAMSQRFLTTTTRVSMVMEYRPTIRKEQSQWKRSSSQAELRWQINVSVLALLSGPETA